MVRNYKRKTVTKYTNPDMRIALDAVHSKELKPSAAAQQFNIPVPTLLCSIIWYSRYWSSSCKDNFISRGRKFSCSNNSDVRKMAITFSSEKCHRHRTCVYVRVGQRN